MASSALGSLGMLLIPFLIISLSLERLMGLSIFFQIFLLNYNNTLLRDTVKKKGRVLKIRLIWGEKRIKTFEDQ